MVTANKAIAALAGELRGEARTGHLDVTEKGVTLPDEVARFVKLENWNLQPDLITDNNVDALWGYNGDFVHWLRSGGNTELLPIRNLQTICLRTKPGQTVTIFYSYYF